MAGLLNPPNMGVYNVSKHAVVSMSETLYQDLQLVTEQIGASVLCPFFVPTGISESQRNRPGALAADKPTKSQLIGKAMNDRAVGSGKVSAADVARFVFDAIGERRFYIYSHPEGAGQRADAPRGHHAGEEPDRSLRRQAGDRRRAARCLARRELTPARPSRRPLPLARDGRSRRRRRRG
jgi:hypothetical protein